MLRETLRTVKVYPFHTRIGEENGSNIQQTIEKNKIVRQDVETNFPHCWSHTTIPHVIV